MIINQICTNVFERFYALMCFFCFALRTIYHSLVALMYPRSILAQLFKLGYASLPIVSLTAFFTGAVLTLQSYIGFSRFSIESAIPSLVVISMTRELGPVIIGLIFAGRVGAGICAELSSMKITDQIDALSTLYAHPMRYLVGPRVIAGLISLPILTILGDIIGIYGGYLVGVYSLGFNQHIYIEKTIDFLYFQDVLSGLVKATFFGFTVTLIGCYYGYHCTSGTQGVGQGTTKSVVISSILILMLNYIITLLLFA